MQIYQPLAFYFPGTVLFVDDNLALLQLLEEALPQSLNIKTEVSARQALKIIEEAQVSHLSMIEPVDDANFDEDLDCLVNVHVSNIVKLLDHPNRFAELNVLVVDQVMPEMSGIELCEKVKDHSFKRIMLTGETDNQLAIQAFNKSLIDHFIGKSEDRTKLINHLESAINHLRHRYFQEQSALIIGAASAQPYSFLKTPEFLNLFNVFLAEYQICEFYLLDTTGSFIAFDTKGNSYWFLVKSEKQMEDFVYLVETSEAKSNLIETLKKRKGLLYFPTSKGQDDVSMNDWQSCLHPVSHGAKGFYVAFVKGEIPGFQRQKISSFKAYSEAVSGAK